MLAPLLIICSHECKNTNSALNVGSKICNLKSPITNSEACFTPNASIFAYRRSSIGCEKLTLTRCVSIDTPSAMML